MTPSQENYIECLYRGLQSGPVRPSDVASALHVSRPSVTRAMNGLAELGLVERQAGGALRLTPAGEALGEQIARRHDCLTQLMVEILQMPVDEADPLVHQLEHLLSDDALRRLEILVGQARGAKAWLTRLHEKLASMPGDPLSPTPFDLGKATVHAGARHELREDADPSRD